MKTQIKIKKIKDTWIFFTKTNTMAQVAMTYKESFNECWQLAQKEIDKANTSPNKINKIIILINK